MKMYLVVCGLEREEENSLKNDRSEINLSIVMILTTKITKFNVKGFYMMRREFIFYASIIIIIIMIKYIKKII